MTNLYFFRDWPTVQKHIKEHPNFNHYFYKCPDDIPWTECELEMQEEGGERDEKRIPCDVLETGEAESVFKNHANHLHLEQNRQEYVFYFVYFIYIFIKIDKEFCKNKNFKET